MLIEGFDIEVYIPDCHPGGEHHAAKAILRTDITEVLPYLNATLKGAIYYPESGALTWESEGRSLAFHAREIASSNVADLEDAAKQLGDLIALVNRTWEGRASIQPDTSVRQRPDPMTLFKLLPGMSCHACGEPSCLTFAVKLTVGEVSLADCPAIEEAQYAERRAKLEALGVA
ncbi:MAG: (Fe-S)-binding protein [Spirochaetota bacterium]